MWLTTNNCHPQSRLSSSHGHCVRCDSRESAAVGTAAAAWEAKGRLLEGASPAPEHCLCRRAGGGPGRQAESSTVPVSTGPRGL